MSNTDNYPDVPDNANYQKPTSTSDYFYENEVEITPWNDRSDCSGNRTCWNFNCNSNWGACTGNQCNWFGVRCPINYPFLLNGQKLICETFTSDIDVNAPSLTDDNARKNSYFTIPSVGGTVTSEHINAIRDSLLDEYTKRRWVLTKGTVRTALINLEEIVGEIIDAPSIQSLATFIEILIDRGASSSSAEDYNFAASEYDNFPAGFSTTNSLSAIPPLSGDTIDASVVLGLMQVVDNLRKACICNDNCACFGECTCNWNCKCNYSDIRLKERVENIKGKDIVNKLPAKSWKYTGFNGTHFSFIAQDVKKTLEDMGYTDQQVVESDENGLLRISRPYELIAFLWDNVKDLNKSFEELNEKVDKLVNK